MDINGKSERAKTADIECGKVRKKSLCGVYLLLGVLFIAAAAFSMKANAASDSKVLRIGTASELAAFRDGINKGTIAMTSTSS